MIFHENACVAAAAVGGERYAIFYEPRDWRAACRRAADWGKNAELNLGPRGALQLIYQIRRDAKQYAGGAR
jgi:hypothetical protein